jgi:hypothetical protein
MTQAHHSSLAFHTLHALRIKGFGSVETLAELIDHPPEAVELHLADLQSREWVLFRENRNLWQLTPEGRAAHLGELAADVPHGAREQLADGYRTFLQLNEAFKVVCNDWQMNGRELNDHQDDEYDEEVLGRLERIHTEVQPVLGQFSLVLARLAPYAPRLDRARERLLAGNLKMLTGVMCNSYHDVWMELHEDLLLTQQIDRAAEGSF